MNYEGRWKKDPHVTFSKNINCCILNCVVSNFYRVTESVSMIHILKRNWDTTIIWRKREPDDTEYPAFSDSKNVKKIKLLALISLLFRVSTDHKSSYKLAGRFQLWCKSLVSTFCSMIHARHFRKLKWIDREKKLHIKQVRK